MNRAPQVFRRHKKLVPSLRWQCAFTFMRNVVQIAFFKIAIIFPPPPPPPLPILLLPTPMHEGACYPENEDAKNYKY
jgi:hypothetical protein